MSGGEIVDANEPSNGSCNMDHLNIQYLLHYDLAVLTDVLNRRKRKEDRDRYKDLLSPSHTWEFKVVKVLHMIRRRQLIEYNQQNSLFQSTRFCEFMNIAFFDYDKESDVVRGPLFREVHPSRYFRLDYSINIISIKVAESDMPYPIKIYGTVLARDQNDYRCVYLFKRGRDDPQLITRRNCTLALSGPYRALSGRGQMYFEFHLKIKGDGAVDQDFSKGFFVRDACCDTPGEPDTKSLESYLSTVELLYMPVPSALEASVGVNFLSGKSYFTGKISASTSGNDTNRMVLYDSKVPGTETKLGSGGSVLLTRHAVAVPLDEDLVLYLVVHGSNNKSERLKFVLWHDVEEQTCKRGSYELQVKIIWKAVFRQQNPHMWKSIEGVRVLW